MSHPSSDPARTYAVLLPGDERRWESASEAERQATYRQHERFEALLGERGHEVLADAALTHSRHARQVRGELDAVTVTERAFAETAEQLTGFSLVRTADLDDLFGLCGLCGLIAEHPTHGAPVEVRAVPAGDAA